LKAENPLKGTNPGWSQDLFLKGGESQKGGETGLSRGGFGGEINGKQPTLRKQEPQYFYKAQDDKGGTAELKDPVKELGTLSEKGGAKSQKRGKSLEKEAKGTNVFLEKCKGKLRRAHTTWEG